MCRLRRIGSAPAIVTGGDFAPNGKRFALTTYRTVHLFRRDRTPIRTLQPTTAGRPIEGESLTFTRGGKQLLLGREGTSSPVVRIPWR